MKLYIKVIRSFLISLIVALLLSGCTSKSATGSLNSTAPTVSSGHGMSRFIGYNNKIYQIELLDSLDSSLVGKKVSDQAVADDENIACYRINNIDTNKAVAVEDKNYGFCKYVYLCDEFFTWESKSYKISYNGYAVEGSYSIDSNQYNLGKSLGKVGTLEVYENAIKGSIRTLLVRPEGVNDASSKDCCFAATKIVNNANTSSK